jgi:lambda repressor-like predicted transcriptional regulator
MAKVILTNEKRKCLDVNKYILGAMQLKGITMTDMAKYIGISRQTLTSRLFNCTVQLRDFWLIADKLELTDTEILALSKLY